MTTRNALIAGLTLLAASVVYALWLYPVLPELVPIHWDLHGRVDGWAPKQWAASFGPGMIALMLGLMYALPAISPRQFEIEPFRHTFNYLMVLVEGLFAFIHWVSLQAALQPEMNSGRVLIAGLFLFFAVVGNLLGKVGRNFWVGIRTPWTLASDRVWTATHRLAARLMFAAGLLGALAVATGAPVAPCFVILMTAILFPVAYSYVIYRRDQ